VARKIPIPRQIRLTMRDLVFDIFYILIFGTAMAILYARFFKNPTLISIDRFH